MELQLGRRADYSVRATYLPSLLQETFRSSMGATTFAELAERDARTER